VVLADFEEALQEINAFCKVIVKKMPESTADPKNETYIEPTENPPLKKSPANETLETDFSNVHFSPLPQAEEPLIDVFEEEDYIRVLVQCRCREQQVTFHVCTDGIKICREDCHVNANGSEICVDNCQRINLRTNDLQLEDRLFVIAKCNNNQVLEAMIPKIRTISR
jgi:hypothetical protein